MRTITPSTVPVGMVLPGMDRAARRIGQIAGPVPTGKTLLKLNGTWQCVMTPSQHVLDAAEHFFQGGHEYDITNDLYDEIIAAVGDGPCRPLNLTSGLYPSDDTTPSADTYSGDPRLA